MITLIRIYPKIMKLCFYQRLGRSFSELSMEGIISKLGDRKEITLRQ
jgi:hypothetical protein